MKAMIDGKWYPVEDRSICKDWLKAVIWAWCLIALGYFLGRLWWG